MSGAAEPPRDQPPRDQAVPQAGAGAPTALPVVVARPSNQPSENLPHDPAVDRVVGIALLIAVVTACAFLLIAAFAAVIIGLETSGQGPADGAASRVLSLLGIRAGWAMTNLVRGAEVVATVMAALLVFLVIRARPTDALMSLLGLIVIAALIVPVNELTRIADSLRGQERNAEAETRILPYQPVLADPDASQIVAQRAMADLQQSGMLTAQGAVAEGWDMPALIEALGLVLYRIEVGHVAAIVRQRGHARLLLEMTAQESRQNLFLSPVMNRIVREDVKALQELGVVSIVYSNLAQVQPTALGIRVLYRLFPEEERVRRLADQSGVRLYPPTGRLVAQVEQLRRQREPLGREIGTFNLSAGDPTGFVREVTVAATPGSGLRLRLREATEVVIEARGLADFDPTLSVRPVSGEGPEARLGEMAASNDDWGGTRDARILHRLEAGEYWVQIVGFDGREGRVRLAVRPATDRDRRARGWPAEMPEDLPALRRVEGGGWREDIEIRPPAAQFRRFAVAEAGTYRVQTARQGDALDPVIELYQQEDRSWTQLAADDDGADNLDARIEQRLEPGAYAVRVATLRGDPGTLTLDIRRVETPGATPAASPGR